MTTDEALRDAEPAVETPAAGPEPTGPDRESPEPDRSEAEATKPEASKSETGKPWAARPPDLLSERAERAGDPDSANTGHQLATVINNFNDRVFAPDSVLGVSGGARQLVPKGGRLDPARIREALEHYVVPVPYDDALDALYVDGVVVLGGDAGLGKRAGGLHLLREVGTETLFVLSPVLTLKELAERPYERGFGYLLLDREDEGSTAETDFVWRTVRDQVRDAGAYLVITTTKAHGPVEAVRHVAWEVPDLRQVLRAHLAVTDVAADVVDTVVEALADGCTMTAFTRVAVQVAGGEPAEKALDDHVRSAAGDVPAWFEKPRTRSEILEVTVLCFAENASDRRFESMLGKLEDVMARHLPLAEQQPDESRQSEPDVLPERRGRRITPDGLIGFERAAAGVGGGRTLVFKRPSYRSRVLVELWERFEARFWDAVREWVDEVIQHQGGVAMAWGLSMLATVDFAEVEGAFLEPWSDGYKGWPGQCDAAFVLWGMCFDDTTAPIALRTAKRWATQGSPAQRWTASVAFSGLLGVCYPIEAVHRLWQLVVQSGDGSERACLAMAVLFGELTDGTDDANKIVGMLDRARNRRGDQRRSTLTMLTILAVLSVRSSATGRPSSFIFLHRYPERVDVLARLWAAILQHRGYRRRALTALWQGLDSLKEISDEPARDIRALGEALARALPVEEHEPLRNDLTVIERSLRKKKAKEQEGSLVHALLTAIERFLRDEGSKESP
ncbi:hypothetical protein AB0M43_35635 [Longispora sp. NPDC051575]|uniref:hypothetical protein n=1 Tax=Longispora sp. NPDC051575 TaxID=3154943 RepID=UPI00343753A7